MVKVGIIGCGRIASLSHLGLLSRMPQVQVVAIADADEGRRETAQGEVPAASAYRDYRSLLDRQDVAAVIVCLPPALHAPCAIDAFEAGKHVYLEKPIALDLVEAHAVLEAWQASGKIGMIGFNFRYNDLYRDMREQIRRKALGELVAARSVFSAASRALPQWKRSRASGGGALLDLGSHHADMTRFLFDEEIVAARATARSQRCEQDTVLLEMQTESGLIVSSFLSMSAIEEHRFEVYGFKGKLSLHRLARNTQLTRPSMPYDRIHRIWRSVSDLHPANLLRGPGEPSFSAALGAFVQAAGQGGQIGPDLFDGYRSLAVLDAAERSLRSANFVEVSHSVPVPGSRS